MDRHVVSRFGCQRQQVLRARFGDRQPGAVVGHHGHGDRRPLHGQRWLCVRDAARQRGLRRLQLPRRPSQGQLGRQVQGAGGAAGCRADDGLGAVPPFDQLTLSTRRLLLRPLRDADAAALLAIFCDPRVMRYWSTPPWTSIDAAHAMIERDRTAMSTGEHLRLGITRARDGALIGTCTLFDLSAQSRRAEVGYALASQAWGRAYMDEALRALLGHGFNEMGLNRVEADIDPRNEASARSLQRLGFKQEGHLRERWIVGDEVSD
ncbi:MAG: GNAT family N-acetyltransferase, partial [Burkholderiales bacterium]|nr:GNAT family N-acetyltransferase [Burkholderiales bacterium]